jgi:hypothetical protein
MSEPLALRHADIGAALTDMWRSVLLFVPKALAFIAILVIGYFVAKFVLKIVDKILERVGFDRAVERGGLGRALERSRYDASDILARLAYYAVLLFTLQLAFGVWGPNAISDLIAAIVSWLPLAFVAIIIVVVAAAIASAVRDLITGALGGLSYGRLIANVAFVFIVGLGVIAALNQVGIATTVTQPVLVAVLATIAGVLIVGVGGGLVRPMQRRWEGWLERMAAESAVIRDKAKAYAATREEDQRRRDEAAREEQRQREAPPTVPVATGAGYPPAPDYPPAGAGRTEAERQDAQRASADLAAGERADADRAAADRAAAAMAETEDSERTQVIPRPDALSDPVAGTMPPPAGRSATPATDTQSAAQPAAQPVEPPVEPPATSEAAPEAPPAAPPATPPATPPAPPPAPPAAANPPLSPPPSYGPPTREMPAVDADGHRRDDSSDDETQVISRPERRER